MLVCVIADAIGLMLMKSTIMTEKLERRGLSVKQNYEVDILQRVTAKEVMDPDPPLVPMNMKLGELADRIARHDPEVTKRQEMLIVNENNDLEGIITRSDVMLKLEKKPEEDMTVFEAGTHPAIVTYPDELLDVASEKMMTNKIGRLPVVDKKIPKKFLDILAGVQFWKRGANMLKKNKNVKPVGSKVRPRLPGNWLLVICDKPEYWF